MKPEYKEILANFEHYLDSINQTDFGSSIKVLDKNNNIDNQFSYSNKFELRSSFSEFSMSTICTLSVTIECNKTTNWIPYLIYEVQDVVNTNTFIYSADKYDEAIKCFDKISEIFDKTQF
ncbi:MAG: hypothetical protein PHY08_13210 [Candidatus Cloacimonetes bacterium]|nr:hypothetical protein [Candidatus Cloacimonadota bacterium]